MSQLAPLKSLSNMKSPKNSPRLRGQHPSPKLQKISSLPLLKHQNSIEKDKECDSEETDKLLNGKISRTCSGDVKNGSPSIANRPGLPRELDDEWYMLTKNRRSASVKFKFNDEMIPEYKMLGDFRRSDTIWKNRGKETEDNTVNLFAVGSPLIACVEKLDEIALNASSGKTIKMDRRQSAGETSV